MQLNLRLFWTRLTQTRDSQFDQPPHPMKWSGKNRSRLGYAGEALDVDRFFSNLSSWAASQTVWQLQWLNQDAQGCQIPVVTLGNWRQSGVYISAGIHGDEPAGSLACLDFLQNFQVPPGFSAICLPLLNPSGMRLCTRENDRGNDMNREFLHAVSDEIRALKSHLSGDAHFELAVFLHEDWESQGFYLYELFRHESAVRHGERLLNYLGSFPTVAIPIDTNPVIDGRDAANGLISGRIMDHLDRPDWPEAFFINSQCCEVTYTLESPSDLDLSSRINLLVLALRYLVDQVPKNPVSAE